MGMFSRCKSSWMSIDRLTQLISLERAPNASALPISERIQALTRELAESGDASLIEPVELELGRCTDSTDANCRDHLADILVAISKTAALPALLRASAADLGDDQDSLHGTLASLLEQNFQTSRTEVLKVLGSAGEDVALQAAALWALGFVLETSDVSALLPTLKNEDFRVRANAAGALGTLGPIPGEIDVDLVHSLGALVKDARPEVRCAAVISLSFLEQPAGLPYVLTLVNDPNPQVRSWMGLSLRVLGDSTHAALVEQLLGKRRGGMPAAVGWTPACARWMLIGLPPRFDIAGNENA